jgi:hypothetical protein
MGSVRVEGQHRGAAQVGDGRLQGRAELRGGADHGEHEVAHLETLAEGGVDLVEGDRAEAVEVAGVVVLREVEEVDVDALPEALAGGVALEGVARG